MLSIQLRLSKLGGSSQIKSYLFNIHPTHFVHVHGCPLILWSLEARLLKTLVALSTSQ